MNLPPAPSFKPIRLVLVGTILALVIASFMSLKLDMHAWFNLDSARKVQEFLAEFAQPDLSPPHLRKTLLASLETLAMSSLASLLAASLSVLLALPASGRMGSGLRLLTRWTLNILRAIPELVWASMMLIAAGLGPLAGTLALGAHTTGVLGRLFADTFENQPQAAEQALHTNGASARQAFLYASLPQALPQMLSYALYRWENNIRAAAVLGVVGAGGLGQMLKFHLSLFQFSSATTVILAMLALVALVDGLSFSLRRRLTL